VHAAPDVTTRRADDADTVAAYAAARASGLAVYGGIALNQHVGGINAAAVAAALTATGLDRGALVAAASENPSRLIS